MSKFSELLKAKFENQMSVTEFAQRIGVRRETVYTWINDTARPSRSNLAKAVEVLGITDLVV